MTELENIDRPLDDPRLAPVVLRHELISQGWTDRTIGGMVKNGTWHKIRRGAYLDGTAWSELDASGRYEVCARAVVRQAKVPVVVSHCSALPFWDGPLWRQDLDEVHLTRPDHRAGRSAAGVRQHRGVLRPEDAVVRHGVEVTSATRTVLDTISRSGTEVGLVVANDFLHRRLTTLPELVELEALMEKWPDTFIQAHVLRLADPRIASVAESRTFFLCWDRRLTMPEPQYAVSDGAGRTVAYLDFAWPKQKVWLEFDGREKYVKFLRKGETIADAVLREKRRETMIANLTGWRCIRITWVDLENPAQTAARIRVALAGGVI